jgi:hypothetical protein
MPLPQLNLRGRYSQGIPVLRTNRISVRAARSLMRGRPPFGDRWWAGRGASISDQRSSGRSACHGISPSANTAAILAPTLRPFTSAIGPRADAQMPNCRTIACQARPSPTTHRRAHGIERLTKPLDIPPTDERASERKECLWMSARRSCRMRNLRKRCSHPKVRSTTQRHRPSLSRDSTPYRAIRAAIPRRRSQVRCALEAYARSACSLPGRLRARPQSPLTAGMASTSGIRKRESCTWAPEILATSGTPR